MTSEMPKGHVIGLRVTEANGRTTTLAVEAITIGIDPQGASVFGVALDVWAGFHHKMPFILRAGDTLTVVDVVPDAEVIR